MHHRDAFGFEQRRGNASSLVISLPSGVFLPMASAQDG